MNYVRYLPRFALLALLTQVLIAPTAFAESSSPLPTPIPQRLTEAAVFASSVGCLDCHTKTDAPSMHKNPAVQIGCADCHGGDSTARAVGLTADSSSYQDVKKRAHVLPKHPEKWPSSANPEHTYAELLKESAEFVKFINPGDLRVAPETCGGCHAKIVDALPKSLMTTSAMLYGGASYNNNILPYKRYVLGESYDRDGKPREVIDPNPITPEEAKLGVLPKLIPFPQWEVVPPGDNFRVFEDGGISIKSQFAEVGNPNPFEESGKPDIRASNRGLGTGARISVPLLNIHKTRLNDPHLSFLGTNDHPGDYRSSGCTACHVVYANNRDPLHSGPYAQFGHEGKTITSDPTIPKEESGHPLKHVFTRAIPTSQCMVCHMHQPNMFVNSYLGYTMWDYESDAPAMWPKVQKDPTSEELFTSLKHNPEEAAARGLWTDREFLKKVSELNPKLSNTQFADYHGHGWNFRAIFKKDRKGHLLDKDGKLITWDDPEKFKKAVHLADIHVDKGMHCIDCHFAQDSHSNGKIVGEVAQAVEIGCEDCHGTVKQRAPLKTSGPAAPAGGNDLLLQRTPFGENRFEWRGETLIQRSSVTEGLEWQVKQVRDSITKGHPSYNEKAARAKTVEKLAGDNSKQQWGNLKKIDAVSSESEVLAHGNDKMSCFTCHSSWVTSCGGCHLPIQANWKKESGHYDGKLTRNWASYNPQVARDEMFQIGIHGPAKNSKIVPIRSSSALVLSSTDANRQKIYIQQPPIAASGHSSQAFAPHFPHTVRTKETKGCTDCHIAEANDNNAIMAQLLLFGTNFVNFMGYYTYVGTGDAGLEAVQVTEWEEPQAVIGSYLHRYAYPAWFKKHQESGQALATAHTHHGAGGLTNTVQLRGEYLYTSAGSGGFRVYDVANIANKGFSERIVTSPVSPLGQDLHVPTTDATSFALPTTMPVAPARVALPENLETPMHPIYHYAAIADRVEGLILVNVDTLVDREPTNNFLTRALTWNPEGILSGARTIQLAGARAFIGTEDALVIVNLDTPLQPVVEAKLALDKPTGITIQFRYAFVTDARGLHTVDITKPAAPRVIATLPLADARNVYVARTYAYVAGGRDGLVIVDVERADKPKLYMTFTDNGAIHDLNDVKIATTNASLFAYLADGAAGLKVVQLTDPERVPTYYGFSPEVKPLVIAHHKTAGPALSISKPLDRDRGVDETGHQVSIFGRVGSRPFTLKEMQRMYLDKNGEVFTVKE
jgi:hypothetical protein